MFPETDLKRGALHPEARNPALKGRVFSNRMLGRVRSSAQLAIPGLKAWVYFKMARTILHVQSSMLSELLPASTPLIYSPIP